MKTRVMDGEVCVSERVFYTVIAVEPGIQMEGSESDDSEALVIQCDSHGRRRSGCVMLQMEGGNKRMMGAVPPPHAVSHGES